MAEPQPDAIEPKRGKHGGERRGAGREGPRAQRKRMSFRERYPLWPLEFFMETLNNANAPYEQRFRAAKEAAPYVHPRLAAIQVQKLAEPQHSLDLTKLSDEELIFFEKILAKAQIVHSDDSSPNLIEHEPSIPIMSYPPSNAR